MDEYEPTEEEKKNGWTRESIKEYAESRDEALNQPQSLNLPIYQNRRHPFKR